MMRPCLLAALLLVPITTARADGPKVGVVDVAKVCAEYSRTRELESEIGDRQAALRQIVGPLSESLTAMRKLLADFKGGDPEQLAARIERLADDIEALEEEARADLAGRLRRAKELLFTDLRRAIHAVAEAQGFDLVIRRADDPGSPASEHELAILFRKDFPTKDLNADVLAQLEAEHAKRRAAAVKKDPPSLPESEAPVPKKPEAPPSKEPQSIGFKPRPLALRQP